jgi:predicted  nucleic acid-binding Zn-ribbon protein
MAEDNPPISTEVPETVTIDTGADAKQLGDLNKEFADFWKEEDQGGETQTTAPPAPDTGAAQETKESKAPPEPKPAKEPPAPKGEGKAHKGEAAKEFSDAEIDSLELPSHVHPNLQADFKTVKEHWKADRARIKAMEAQATQLQGELATAKQNAWTPEQKADYEHAATIRRRFDFASDPDFIARFHAPIQSRFDAVLEEAVGVLPDRAAAQAWANHIRENYQPDQLDKQWWLNSVLAKVPGELERQALLGSVTDLLKLQRERDFELHRRTQDKSAYDNWIQEKTTASAERIKGEIMAEIGEQEKQLGDVLPKDVEAAKTAEERKAIEAHNERFTRLNKHFMETMQDISKAGPRAWVRASVAATRAMYMQEEYDKLEEEFKSIKTERDQLRAELDRIAGARRKISNTTGTPPATASKSSQGLSIKDLDVRKSFEKYNWGDT